ncbi:MAG: hypothetical protein K8S87_07875 [Planctomycetes bacterium]|nr:hypothetical protein [Planctomycetota bacterium]
MARKNSQALLTPALIIIMVLSLSLPIATYFLQLKEKKDRYNVLDSKFKKRQMEFEEILFKLGSVEKIQRKRRLYEKVNEDLSKRYCHSVAEAGEILDEFVEAISTKSSRSSKFKIQFKRNKPTRAILPGYELVIRQTVSGNASMEDFWRIMSQLTKIGHDCYYCTNKVGKCPEYAIFRLKNEVDDFKSCPECKEILTKGIIPKLNYIEDFYLSSENFIKMGELRLNIILAVPISTRKH